MNSFCNSMNIGINPLKENFDITSANKFHQNIGIENLNPELLDFLKKFNLTTKYAPVFTLRPHQKLSIHSDGKYHETDFVKLNFIYNEENSVMVWYKPLINKQSKDVKVTENTTDSNISVPYVEYQPDEVIEIHRQSLNGCALVQAAIPHTVFNYKKTRHCLTLTLWDIKNTDRKISMEEGIEIFKDYFI